MRALVALLLLLLQAAGGAATRLTECKACTAAAELLIRWAEAREGPIADACAAATFASEAEVCRDLVRGLGPLLLDVLDQPGFGSAEEVRAELCSHLTEHCAPLQKFSSRVRSTAWSFDEDGHDEL